MAFVQVDIMSNKLHRIVSFNAIIPVGRTRLPGVQEEERPFKTLYLLHGIYGNHTSWVNRSRILDWAEEMELAIIMPAGENHFYVDHTDSGQLYGEYIGQELVELTRKMFPLSRKREDTFIGGLSMGGYGALRNGLKYCDTFSRIVALSSALIMDMITSSTSDASSMLGSKGFYTSIFGDTDKVPGSDMDYEALIDSIQKNKLQIPDIYMSCGTEDPLLDVNRRYSAFLKSRDVEHTYIEGPGGHTWEFWDEHLRKAMDWLPLEKIDKLLQ